MKIAVQKEVQETETQATRSQEREKKGSARIIKGKAFGSSVPLLCTTRQVSQHAHVMH
jgi:hypothetical protein